MDPPVLRITGSNTARNSPKHFLKPQCFIKYLPRPGRYSIGYEESDVPILFLRFDEGLNPRHVSSISAWGGSKL